MLELERASFEVEEYENLIDRMTTLHKDCSEKINWEELVKKNPPQPPANKKKRENSAQEYLDNFKPTFIDNLFNLKTKKIDRLNLLLVKAIEEDKAEFSLAEIEFKQTLLDFEEMVKLAKKIISSDLIAYKDALDEFNPFFEIAEIGSNIQFFFLDKETIKVNISAHEDKVIPKQSKTLLKSGKLSVKDLPISKYNEIYQDYICSVIIRVSRELFSLLPFSVVLITVNSKLLNTSTGRLDTVPILSVKVLKQTLDNLNLDEIDPSDAMKNFIHNMNFKKTTGFTAVQELG